MLLNVTKPPFLYRYIRPAFLSNSVKRSTIYFLTYNDIECHKTVLLISLYRACILSRSVKRSTIYILTFNVVEYHKTILLISLYRACISIIFCGKVHDILFDIQCYWMSQNRPSYPVALCWKVRSLQILQDVDEKQLLCSYGWYHLLLIKKLGANFIFVYFPISFHCSSDDAE